MRSTKWDRFLKGYAHATHPGEQPTDSSFRLMLIGGGPKPQEAVDQIIRWVTEGKKNRSLLLICWASREPAETASAFCQDFINRGFDRFELSLRGPKTQQEKRTLLAQIENCDGIFFSGGDQALIMDVLKDHELLEAFHQAYITGTPFGGTSAGTAIMSLQMIAGDRDPHENQGSETVLGLGLGLLPHVVLDQHFFVRKRQARLMDVVLEHSELAGVGVEEGSALLITSGRYAQVMGPGKTMIVDGKSKPGSLIVDIIGPEEQYDLIRRTKIQQPAYAAFTLPFRNEGLR